MENYKIGDFATYLGVTPDLIKHYEKFDILKSEKKGSSNYRYYNFRQSPKIFHSKMYQKMGFSLKEISFLLNIATTEELLGNLYDKRDALEFTIKKETFILQNINKIIKYCEEIKNNTFDGSWFINDIESFYFFPHAENFQYNSEFIEDMPINEWIESLPITELCTKIILENNVLKKEIHGFSVNADYAESMHLKLHPYINKIPVQKMLVYKCECYLDNKKISITNDVILKKALSFVISHHFEVVGDIYFKTLFTIFNEDKPAAYMLVYIPIK